MNRQAMADESKRVGIWIRVSTEDQAEGESPEHHERRARMYAESKGWQVVTVYHLEAVSGKSVKEHPETGRMLGDVKAGRISGLIFSKLARFARNTRELLEFAEYFREYDAHLISLQEAIDTSTPVGRLFYTLIAALAQWEREEIAERVAASVPIRAKMGKPLGGAAPLGYRWLDGELVPDPDEAPVRRRIYELFREQRRIKTVARLLNEEGHRTRRGAKFSDTTVRRLLEDPTAKGWRRANWTRSLGENRQWKEKPEEEWVWHEVEPIVPEELWEECNAILAERKRGRKPSKRPRHLFAGLILCEKCGRKMYVPSNSPKYVCQSCRRKLPVEDMEEIFAEEIKAFVLDPDSIAGHLQEADKELENRRELLTSLTRERDKRTAESDKLYRLYIDDELPAEGFGRRNKPLEERISQLDQEIPRLQAEIDFMAINLLSHHEIVSEAGNLYSRWSDLAFEEKRTIVESLVEEVVVGDEEIKIDLVALGGTAAKKQHGHTGSSPPGA